jgi:hypothetical protein
MFSVARRDSAGRGFEVLGRVAAAVGERHAVVEAE